MPRLNEFELIRRLTRRLPKKKGGVRLGVGDDCAIVRIPKEKDLLVTTDMLIEGCHFRTDWPASPGLRRSGSSMRQIGRKGMLVNLSDIAAMGGVPRFAVISVGLPRRLSLKEAEELFRGIQEIARKTGVLIVGGDTNRSRKLILNITLLGEVEKGRGLTRSGARAGDLIHVTGRLGDADAALFRRRHHEPPLRLSLGQFLVKNRIATSCIDVSDGLLGDLGHLLDQSRRGAVLYADRLPGKSNLKSKLSGGEDYELLFTVPPRVKIPKKIHGVPVPLIGRILPLKGGRWLVDSKGRKNPWPKKTGFRHF
ncbi:MAG: thiamine-phosphate kinase [Deltaproteobacteria bacterium]|nr:thiamine-phosphate kinase [Deltaproteobacteria bacterium]